MKDINITAESGEINELRRRISELEAERDNVRVGLQRVIDGVAERIVSIAPDYTIKLMNRSAVECYPEKIYCYQTLHSRNSPCTGSDYVCTLREVMKSGKPARTVHRHVLDDGSECDEEILASPVFDEFGELLYIIETCRDISERRRIESENIVLQERLLMKQKEDSIVTLAGGIAHDFNNILMSVLGNIEMLQMKMPKGSKDYRLAENVVEAVDRMTFLVQQLLAYAKEGIYPRQLIDINAIIREALNLAHKGKALDVSISLDLNEALSPVMADRRQLVQAFINIFLNAFEAMENQGGRLSVRTEQNEGMCPPACGRIEDEHSVPCDEFVYISISDTGPGIEKEIQPRIFDPFFSTKFLGRGLGLAAVAGIIRRHGGCISVESLPGCGSTFHVCLPCGPAVLEESG